MAEQTRTDVVLLSMPFAPHDAPSPGLHLLSACLKQAGFSARVLYPSARFVHRLGEKAYVALARPLGRLLVGEWVFSRHVCPSGETADFLAFLRTRLAENGQKPDQPPLDALPEIVAAAGDLLDDMVAEVLRLRPRVVGLSSMFHQHLACLAAARRLKAADPGLFIVLGGANCRGEAGPETLRQFPWVDAVVSGPGEVAMVELVRSLDAGQWPAPRPGVFVRAPDGGVPPDLAPGIAAETPLDALPMADYDDYLADADARALAKVLPVEASRGCWWGQKSHCVFCSENAESMHYRSKSPERVFNEIAALLQRHPGYAVSATDEILSLAMIDTVMPRLAAMPGRRRLFFSIKANIHKHQLATLAAAGVDNVQPGIESLDDDILTPMRKGISALRNIQTLKWCRELGIVPVWNILTGFPFDRPDAYARMAAKVPLLTHLEPPGLFPISLQRFSPLFTQAEQFGLSRVAPYAGYRHIYPFAADVVARLAYHFDFHCDHPEPPNRYLADLRRAVAAWRTAAGSAALFHTDEAGRLFIGDTRPAAIRRLHVLEGLERAVLLACDGIQSLGGVVRAVAEHGASATAAQVADALGRLVADRLVMADREMYLALPVRLGQTCLPPVGAMAEFLAAKAALQSRGD